MQSDYPRETNDSIGGYCDTINSILPIVTSSGFSKICGISRFGSRRQYYYDRIRKLIKYHGIKSKGDWVKIQLSQYGIHNSLYIDSSQLPKEAKKSPMLIKILTSGHVKEKLAQQQLCNENDLLTFEEQVKFHSKDYHLATTPDSVIRLDTQLRNKINSFDELSVDKLSILENDFINRLCTRDATDMNKYAVMEIKSRFHEDQVGPFQEIELGYWLQVMGQIHLSNAICGYFYSWTKDQGCTLWCIERNDILWDEIRDNVINPFIHYNIFEGNPPDRMCSKEKIFLRSLFTMYRDDICKRLY